MAYDLHIEKRGGGRIDLGEWRAAVASIDGVRLFSGDAHTGTCSKTGRVVSTPATDGDTEVYFPDTQEWLCVFRWRKGDAVFPARFDESVISHPVWQAAVALATALGSVICGDEGEEYDFETGRAKAAEPGATDNPDDAQRLREDH